MAPAGVCVQTARGERLSAEFPVGDRQPVRAAPAASHRRWQDEGGMGTPPLRRTMDRNERPLRAGRTPRSGSPSGTGNRSRDLQDLPGGRAFRDRSDASWAWDLPNESYGEYRSQSRGGRLHGQSRARAIAADGSPPPSRLPQSRSSSAIRASAPCRMAAVGGLRDRAPRAPGPPAIATARPQEPSRRSPPLGAPAHPLSHGPLSTAEPAHRDG